MKLFTMSSKALKITNESDDSACLFGGGGDDNGVGGDDTGSALEEARSTDSLGVLVWGLSSILTEEMMKRGVQKLEDDARDELGERRNFFSGSAQDMVDDEERASIVSFSFGFTGSLCNLFILP